MNLPPSLPSWRSTYELFHRASLRRCADHLVRVQRNRHCHHRLISPSPMMANQTIAHVPRVRLEEMNWNNMKRQENQTVQMVEQKDRCVVRSLPWPPRNTVQTRRYH